LYSRAGLVRRINSEAAQGCQRKMSGPQGLYAACIQPNIYSLYRLYIGPVGQSWPRGTESVGRGAQGQ